MKAKYFEDFSVGEVFHSPGRTVTDTHFALFAAITGDAHPMHYDDEYARRTVFGRRVAHGLLVTSLGAMGASSLSLLVEELSFKHVTSRLAKILLDQVRQAPEGNGEAHAPHRITQQELAAMVGTAREVVARALKNLEKQGAIKVARQRIVIVNRKELERLI